MPMVQEVVIDMRIMFDDDKGNRVAMECTSIAATPDPDGCGWAVLVTEAYAEHGCIVCTGLDETVAKDMVRHLFDTGRLVQD